MGASACGPRHSFIDPQVSIGEEVLFAAGNHTLSGSLLRTPKASPAPAMIIAIGSGAVSYRPQWAPDGDLRLFKSVAETFLDMGISVLLLEKRGVNRSGGNWGTTDFAGRSRDVKAAIDYLRRRSDILGGQIGLCGHSQGGWIVQQAAADYPRDVACIIMLAGPACSVKEQVLYDYRMQYTRQGLTPSAIERKTRTLKSNLDLLGAISPAIKVHPLSYMINYDPKDVLPRIRCPVLAVFAGNDTLVEAESNARCLRQGMKRGGNTRCKVVTIPQATHYFFLAPRFYDWKTTDHTTCPSLVEALRTWQYLPRPGASDAANKPSAFNLVHPEHARTPSSSRLAAIARNYLLRMTL